MKLNESEHVVLNWLKTKYEENDIKRKSNASPDFICPDESYEVKHLYRNTLLFNNSQIESIEKTNPLIVVVSNGNIVNKFRWSERADSGYKIHIGKKLKGDMTTIWISEKHKLRLENIGNMGDSFDKVLDKLLDVYEEVKSERLIEEKMR